MKITKQATAKEEGGRQASGLPMCLSLVNHYELTSFPVCLETRDENGISDHALRAE